VVPVVVEDTSWAGVVPVVHLYTDFVKEGVLAVFPGHAGVLGHREVAVVHIQGGISAGDIPVEEGNFPVEEGSLPVEEDIHLVVLVVVVDLQHLVFHHPLNKPAYFCPGRVQRRIQGYSLPAIKALC